jgi:hypothetical protein
MVCRCECVDDVLYYRVVRVAGMRQLGLGLVRHLRGWVDRHCNAYALELAEGVEAEIVRTAGYHLAGRGYGPGERGGWRAAGLPIERRKPALEFWAGMCLIESALTIGAPAVEAL